MSGRRKWGESKQMVIDAHALGLTVKQTVKHYGLSILTVRNLVARLGIRMTTEKRGTFDKVTRKYLEYKSGETKDYPRGESESQ